MNCLLRVSDVDAQQLLAKCDDKSTGGDTGHNYTDHANQIRFLDPIVLVCTHILADVIHGSLVQAVHDHIHEAFNIGCRTITGHEDGIVKRIKGGLNKHIGNGKQRTLYARRQTDANDLQQLRFVKAELLDRKPA